jgi:hypothetical protein
VVLRALEKEPEQRYQHASDVKTEVERIRSAPAAAINHSTTSTSDRGFVVMLVAVMILAWTGVLIGDSVSDQAFVLPPVTVVAVNLLTPVAVTALAAWLFSLQWRRQNEEWFARLAKPAPMLIACHLLMFSIAMFASQSRRLCWDELYYDTPDWKIAYNNLDSHTNGAKVIKTSMMAYGVWAWDTWVGPLAVGASAVGLFALLLTTSSPRRVRLRAGIVMLVGLATCGAMIAYLVTPSPGQKTFTRQQYRDFDPKHADGSRLSSYDAFTRAADARFDEEAGRLHLSPTQYEQLKADHSRVIVRHDFQDGPTWLLLPGALMLLCGALLWRQAPTTAAPQAIPVSSEPTTPRLARLTIIAAVVGILGPPVGLPLPVAI